jgi:hypothetical protein
MPGLELLGAIAGAARLEARDEIERGFEEHGLFVLGDARDVAHYSGPEPGARWLCRIEGPLLEIIGDWPTPGRETWRYHPTEEAARAMFDLLRAHAFQRLPGLEAHDCRHDMPLNAPTARAEVLVQNGTAVFRLFYDRMADLQVAVRQTNCVRRFAAHPAHESGPALLSYYSQNDRLYLAIARGASGAAEHVVIVYSPKHEPQPVISQGMPRAEKIGKHTKKPIAVPSGFLVAFWGRVPGPRVMLPTQGHDPAPLLHQYLGDRVAAALSSNVPGLDDRLGDAAAAYAIRVEPGEYEASYHELDPSADGGYSFLSLSRVGAAPYQPLLPGNAGGRKIGGMDLEQYAMMQLEREAILGRLGHGAGQALAELCRKYGQPVACDPTGAVNLGYAARITDWDLAIQGNASLSAQWVAARTVAQMRLSGQEPTPEQLAQIGAHQNAVQSSLAQAATSKAGADKQLFDGSCQIIELARTTQPPQLVEAARGIFVIETQRAGTPAYGFYKAIEMLKQPEYKGNPRFASVDQVAGRLAEAHWLAMKEEDRKFEGGNVKSYVRQVIADVYEKNGLPVPGVGGFLSRMLDKL